MIGRLSKTLRFIVWPIEQQKGNRFQSPVYLLHALSLSRSRSLCVLVIRSSNFMSFSGRKGFLYSLPLHCAWKEPSGSQQPRGPPPSRGTSPLSPGSHCPVSFQFSLRHFSLKISLPPSVLAQACGGFEASTVWPVLHPVGLLSSTSQAERCGPREHMQRPHLDWIPFCTPAWPLSCGEGEVSFTGTRPAGMFQKNHLAGRPQAHAKQPGFAFSYV